MGADIHRREVIVDLGEHTKRMTINPRKYVPAISQTHFRASSGFSVHLS